MTLSICSFTSIITLWTDHSDTSHCAAKHVKDFPTLQFSLQFFSCPYILSSALHYTYCETLIIPYHHFARYKNTWSFWWNIYCRMNLQHIIQYFLPYSQYQSTITWTARPWQMVVGFVCFNNPPSYTGCSTDTRQVCGEKADEEASSQSSRFVGDWV